MEVVPSLPGASTCCLDVSTAPHGPLADSPSSDSGHDIANCTEHPHSQSASALKQLVSAGGTVAVKAGNVVKCGPPSVT